MLAPRLVDALYAQKGVGDATGIASRAVKPEIVTLSGKMVEVRTGLCESSTGRSPVGTHIILETSQGKKLNVHLGPASAVADKVAKLNVGDELVVKAFRTDKMKIRRLRRPGRSPPGDNRLEFRDAESPPRLGRDEPRPAHDR